MLRNPKFLHCSSQFLHPPILPPSPPPPQVQNIPNPPSFPIIKQCCKFSRRELAVGSSSLILLLLGSQNPEPFLQSLALAEETMTDTNVNEGKEENSNSNSNSFPNCTNTNPTRKVFLDISIDKEPVGRIIIGLYGDNAPAGAARFSNLVSGAAGITYRRKEFVRIMPNYVQHGGVRSYGVDAELANRTGSELSGGSLVDEWQRSYDECPGTKNLAGTVSIIVRDPSKPPPKVKLVAREGKLVIDQEEVGIDPNGTEFVIATKDSPELDASALVVGRVLEGMKVVERIGQVKTVNDNTSSPYFRVAKLIGDKRAVVAERGFNRPYSKGSRLHSFRRWRYEEPPD
ncbi:hypothetical protein CIPAW_16G083100 [Carya illinoinensis]|uniref:PPIase cyclophilin-type domain-containing protein n=1 Tax=Carya illinoinensis TaxID=32201 RepID=A0A8T1N913_CARIL|nr:hypothetical protein CIPAW_16G083100 [Carya illinoinensis]KAG6672797.1 hypothetical protein I3842_16G077000 [Carya illinoinensis]